MEDAPAPALAQGRSGRRVGVSGTAPGSAALGSGVRLGVDSARNAAASAGHLRG